MMEYNKFKKRYCPKHGIELSEGESCFRCLMDEIDRKLKRHKRGK